MVKMNYQRIYSNLLKHYIRENKASCHLLLLGIFLGKSFVKLFPDKRLPPSLRYLHGLAFDYTYKGIFSKNSIFTNLFAPSEIFHAFGLNPIFVEAISAFLSGLDLEDELILKAESMGISESFCSFHKVFIGSVISNILRRPRFMVATSSICDANLNTFRLISDMYNIPFYFIDIPTEFSNEAVLYVSHQIKELMVFIEKLTGRKMDLRLLSSVIEKENQTRMIMNEALKLLRKKHLQTTLTFEMFMLYTSHTFIGKDQTLKFYQMFLDDLKKAEDSTKKGIFFIHTLPLFEQNFKEFFNLSKDYSIIGMDLNYDCLEEIPADDPIRAISMKLLKNPYNKDFQ